MKVLRTFWAACHGSTAAEFGLVLPILSLLLIGTIDISRFLWVCNLAEKATQVGARFAVVTDIVPTGLSTYDFVGSGGLTQGDPIPQSQFGGASCSSTGGSVSCACNAGATCPALGTAKTQAFTYIVTRMQQFFPAITPANVVISYEYSGLGYAGDPHGTDVAPLVVVKLRNMTFTPNVFRFFGNTTVNLPSFATALTLEDGAGNTSN